MVKKNLGKKKLWVKKFREFSLFSYHLSEDWRTALHETQCNRLLIQKLNNKSVNILGWQFRLGRFQQSFNNIAMKISYYCVQMANLGVQKVLYFLIHFLQFLGYMYKVIPDTYVLQLTFSLELGKNYLFVNSLRNQEFP